MRVVSPAHACERGIRVKLAGLYVIWVHCVAVGTFLVACYAQLGSRTLHPSGSFVWGGLFLFLILGIVAEKSTIQLENGAEVSASFLAYFLSGTIVGPLGAFITAAVAQAFLWKKGQWGRNFFFISTIATVTACASLLYWAAIAWLSDESSTSPVLMALVGIACGAFFQIANYMIMAPRAWLHLRMHPLQVWRVGFQPFLPFHFFFLAVSLGLIYIYRQYSQSSQTSGIYSTLLVMLFLLPVLGLIYAFRAYAHQRELARTNGALALRNERLFLQAVASQVTALDLKDNYTARHSAAVSQWATDIALKMGLSPHDVNITHLASLMHDVGKIGVPDEVLNYPGRLDPVAWAMVETHCQNGYKILSDIDQCEELATVVLHHHEAYDGSGYPSGKAGEDIPLISRIICVADSYSAMVSDRPYRKRLPTEVAKKELRDKSGIQFDPQVVECFLQLLEEHDARYQEGEAADFRVEFQKVKYLRDLPPDPELEAAAAST
jgi:HD-GYP domain-containing protein (c-di-GMP phosphodiesterase class II)